ncbi:Low-density lipoprotein receptor-related protein 2, partial [Stegodyphus mimosarum]
MSIGFHVTGPTTEIYTLKENTDYITDYSSRGYQTSSTTLNSQDSVTEQASTLPTNKYIINGNEDNFYVTTVLSSDSTVTSAVSANNDGTENFKQDHSTLNPLKNINYSGTSTEETVKPLSLAFTTPIPDIIDTEETGTPISDVGEKFVTAVSDVEKHSTVPSLQDENITTVVSDVEESYTTVFSEPINNFTAIKSDAEENVVTTVPPFFSTAGSSDTDENITTIKSSTFVPSYSNKTPEVRSFDNFTSFIENFTITSDAGYINTDFTLFNSSVELSTLSDNPSINSSTFLPSTEPPVTESSESETAFPKHTSPNIDTAVNATSGATSANAFEEPNSSNTTLNFFTTENISTISPQNTDTDITENEEVVYNTVTVKSEDNMATNTPASSILDTTSTLSDVTKMHEEINTTSEFILETFTEVESNFSVTESSFPDSTTNQNRLNGSTNSTKDLEGNPKYLLTTNVFPETSTIPTSFTESVGETQSEMSEMSVFSEKNVTTLSIPVTEATNTELSGEAVTLDVASDVTTVVSSESANSDNTQYSITTMMTDRVISTTNSDSDSTIFEPQTKATTAFFEVISKLDNSLLTNDNNTEYSTTSYMVTTNNPPNDTEFIQDMNMTTETETSEQVSISTVSVNESYVTELPKNSEEISTLNYTSFENDTIVTTDESYFDSNSTDMKNTTDGDYLDALTVTPINLVFAEENSTFLDDSSNFTAETYEDALNGTTTDAAVGLVCREDQFLCGPLNVCINNTFLCDGIEDCPDGQDEFKCQDSCQSNFRCVNSSMCIMSEARCDGIWDCEDGTDEDDCS